MSRFSHFRQKGMSLFEVILATLLLSVALVPMIDAFYSASHTSRVHGEMLQDHFRLTSLMEEVLAEPFSQLMSRAAAVNSQTVATSYSDAPGTPQRRRVFIYVYDLANVDGDNNPFTIADPNSDTDNNPFTGNEANIETLWLRVDIENTAYAMESLSGEQ